LSSQSLPKSTLGFVSVFGFTFSTTLGVVGFGVTFFVCSLTLTDVEVKFLDEGTFGFSTFLFTVTELACLFTSIISVFFAFFFFLPNSL
jgi:hypothetical protein